jgi:glycosyltransferase involved in cell wall biosynthesis
VLLFNPSYPPMACGVGDYTSRLAAALAAGGHDATVLTSAVPAVAPVRSGAPRVLPVLRDWSVTAFLRAIPHFARPRPDLVISQYPALMPGAHARLLYLLPALAKAALGRPRVVVVVHEFARTEPTAKRLLGLAFAAADEVIAVTAAERDAIAGHHPRAARKTRVVPIASNVPALDFDDRDVARLRRELSPSGQRVLAFFGLLSPSKGFEDLLRAAADGDATVAATGALRPGDAYHDRLARLITELRMEDRVRWLGYLPEREVALLLRAADAVVLPFAHGAVGNNGSLLAALVNGAAVVTTRGDATPEWLRDGENALVAPAGDPSALAHALDRLRDDPALAATVRAGARELSARFDWVSIARELTRSRDRSASPPRVDA